MTDTPNWPRPCPVAVARYQPRRRLNLSRLTPDEKRGVWERIKTERPALAALLREAQDDTTPLHALVTTFNAEIRIDPFEETNHE